jgi:hypothetical protein
MAEEKEEKKPRWLDYLALTTVIFAVCATLSTFKGGGYSTRSVLSQTQAANQWAYFQAKSIKGYLYDIQKESLDLEMKTNRNAATKQATAEYEKRLELYAQKIKKYEDEKAEISKEAKRLEAIRDDAQRHSSIFGLAVIFLQIAILLSSIAALMKKKMLWLVGSISGAAGLVYFANGFLLFF